MKVNLLAAALAVVVLGVVGLAQANQSIHVVNPSFQEQVFPAWPGYVGGVDVDANATNPTEITGWAYTTPGGGQFGINPVTTITPGDPPVVTLDYPFWDNGLIPDNNALLFMQGPGSVTQTLSGFEPGKQYWLQFYVNGRSSNGSGDPPGPGDSGIPNAAVFFDGANLLGDGVFTPINPVEDSGNRTLEWTLVHVPVTPTSESADLTFTVDSVGPAPVGGSTDGTLLLDAVSVIQRDADQVVIQNPSFEASGLGVPFPGYQPNIAGWNASGGNIGTQPNSDGSSPFADNGATPDGDNVAFIQIDQSLSQQIDGFEVGKEYEINFFYNARSTGTPHLEVTLGESSLLDTDVTAVDPAETFDSPYHQLTSTFTAANESELLTFSQTATGDVSVLLDNVSIRLLSSVLLGDVNLDGEVNGLDVDPFVSRVTDNVFQLEADMNEDGEVNGLDVDPFVDAVLGGSQATVPEPSTIALAALAMLAFLAVRRKRRR